MEKPAAHPAPAAPSGHRFPLFGPILSALAKGGVARLWVTLALAVVLVVAAVIQWGPAALVLVMLALVPVIFVLFAIIASPWARSGDSDH